MVLCNCYFHYHLYLLSVLFFQLQCTRTDSLDVFFKDTQLSSVPKIAVIGCGCSIATEPVAEISHQWNITQVATYVL